jgi:hypothetical protein
MMMVVEPPGAGFDMTETTDVLDAKNLMVETASVYLDCCKRKTIFPYFAQTSFDRLPVDSIRPGAARFARFAQPDQTRPGYSENPTYPETTHLYR